METSIMIAGFGGQGVQTLGKLLTYAANESGLFVTFYPSYGAEMRGGTSNCTVVISDSEIAAPYRNTLDCVVALNAPSYNAFGGAVGDGGTLVVNSDLIECDESGENRKLVRLPLNDLANKMGSSMTLNVIMLGFLAEYFEGISTEAAEKVVHLKLGKRKDMLEMNLQAFACGVSLAADLK